MATLRVVQHVDFEGPGAVAQWAASRGMSVELHQAAQGAFPEPAVDDLVCIMGGPMGVHDVDVHPWLGREKEWLHGIVSQGRNVLGICLGAQLLANVLGAKVRRCPAREIGWMPVTWLPQAREPLAALPESTVVLHWHGDTFDIPEGATRLAESTACQNQAFRLGNVVGLQFHLEAGPDECDRLIHHCAADLDEASPTVHPATRIQVDAREHAPVARERLFRLLDSWFG